MVEFITTTWNYYNFSIIRNLMLSITLIQKHYWSFTFEKYEINYRRLYQIEKIYNRSRNISFYLTSTLYYKYFTMLHGV
jgi:hypothetical protein